VIDKWKDILHVRNMSILLQSDQEDFDSRNLGLSKVNQKHGENSQSNLDVSRGRSVSQIDTIERESIAGR
jgi:hypothetical protein